MEKVHTFLLPSDCTSFPLSCAACMELIFHGQSYMGCSAKKNPIEKPYRKDTAREKCIRATILREYQVQIQLL
jgi:hypothetical protein